MFPTIQVQQNVKKESMQRVFGDKIGGFIYTVFIALLLIIMLVITMIIMMMIMMMRCGRGKAPATTHIKLREKRDFTRI